MRHAEGASRELWDRVLAECPYATFFHSHAWASVWEKTYPQEYRIAARAFRFGPDDWAVLPLMENGRDCGGLFRSYFSNPPGVYGGFIANRPFTAEKARALMSSLPGLRCSSVYFFGNPYADWSRSLSDPDWAPRENFTHVMDLRAYADDDALLKASERGIRAGVRKGQEAGFTFGLAETEEDVKKYCGVYEDVLRLRGKAMTNQYEAELFLNFHRLGSPNVHFWLVRKDETVLGGILAFRQGEHYDLWHATFREEWLAEGSSKFLFHNVMCRAKAWGLRYFDFNPSGGHAGTSAYKEKFGAERLPFHSFVWEGNRVYGAYRAGRKRLGLTA